MQTFLPYSDFTLTAKCLDNKRLGKQRVEAYQILKTLRGESKGWANHPAVKMWRGYESALALYMNACITEWIARGYKNTMKIEAVSEPVAFPPWLGDDSFHRSHQSNLVRKNAEHYSPKFPQVPNDLPYVWPDGS